MSELPRVAIITRTKNRTVLLQRAIDSVLGQSLQDWVHVIVNDGGDPTEVDALVRSKTEAYRGRVRLIHNPVSVGMEAASNIGIRAAGSDYIVIHDDDDSWKPAFLARCVAFLDTPPPTVGTPIRGVITHSTRILERMDHNGATQVASDPFNDWMTGVSLYRLAASNCFPPISFVFSRAALDEIGGFREDLPVLGDWDFHLRFAERFEIGLIPEALANYHHRVELTDGVYGNSVIAGDDKHVRYGHLYRNDLLRKDLATGRTGLGFLVNVAGSFEVLHGQFSVLDRVITRLRRVRVLRWLYARVRGRA